MKKNIALVVDFVAGEIVYHRTCDCPGIVTGHKRLGNGSVTYLVSFNGCMDTEHLALELTTEKPIDGIQPESNIQHQE